MNSGIHNIQMSILGRLLAFLQTEHKVAPPPLGSQVPHLPGDVARNAASPSVPAVLNEANVEIPVLAAGVALPSAIVPESSAAARLTERRKAIEEMVTFHLAGTSKVAPQFAIPTVTSQVKSSRLRWVTADETFGVQGVEVRCGLLYAGLDTRGEEPSMIHPNWPLERVWSRSDPPLPAHPSYASFTPTQRFAYIDWLSKGAVDPRVDPAFGLLRLFGIERRLILDDACLGEEAQSLVAEIDRLTACFAGSWTLLGSGYRLKQYVYLRRELASPANASPPDNDRNPFGLPISILFGAARFANEGTPLPENWALRWSLAEPLISRRTAVERCPNEFALAFAEVYRRRHGVGIQLPQNKTKLKYTYTAASRAVSGPRLQVALGHMSDLSAVQGPRNKLQAVVDEASALIDPYSRLVGRTPEKAGSLEAFLTLSPSLWPAVLLERVEAVRGRAQAMSPSPFADLLSQLGHTDAPSATTAKDLATALQTLGFGFEPDVLDGARRPAASDQIVLFELVCAELPKRIDETFRCASITVALMAFLALADGQASSEENIAVERAVAAWPGLVEDQRQRLRAQYVLQVHHPPSMASLKTRAAALDESARLEMGHALAALANADGTVSSAEVRLLEQLYRALKLDAQMVYQHLYSNERPQPASTQQGTAMPLDVERLARLQQETAQVSRLLSEVFQEEVEPETAAPEEAPILQARTAWPAAFAVAIAILEDHLDRPFDEALTNYLVIDLMHADGVIAWSYLSRRLLQKSEFRTDLRGATSALKATVEALEDQGILTRLSAEATLECYGSAGQVFTITPRPWAADKTPDPPALLPGLDQKHSALLRTLLARPEWKRAELLELAAGLQLMLDGALERINEAFLDATGNIIVEGDDPVFVDQSLPESLTS